MKFNLKLAASFFLGATVATSVLFLSPLKAQSSNTLSGQYGCLVNKNLAGFEANLLGSNSVGYHYMWYLDFTNKKSQMVSLHMISNYGKNTAVTSFAPGASNSAYSSGGSGTLAIDTNYAKDMAYLVKNTITSPEGVNFVVTSVFMPVNGGNTLMVSSGTGGNGDSEPYTGVCNKI